MDESKWDVRYLQQAALVASWSKDPSKKVGCVITRGKFPVSQGFNGFPSRIPDAKKDYNNKALKRRKVIHAEINAILAAKCDLIDHTLYVYPLMPCDRCAAVIIQVGITRVVFPYQEDNTVISSWQASFDIAIDMFKQAKVELVVI